MASRIGRPPISDRPLLKVTARLTDQGMRALEDLSTLYGESHARTIERAVLMLRNDLTQEQSSALETIRDIRAMPERAK